MMLNVNKMTMPCKHFQTFAASKYFIKGTIKIKRFIKNTYF